MARIVTRKLNATSSTPLTILFAIVKPPIRREILQCDHCNRPHLEDEKQINQFAGF